MVEGKQVKVDNWGIFFLQRLQQFYNKTFFCDLTLRFEDNVQLKVHRLVMNACTEYFQMLENTCQMDKDCLLMPSNLPSDVVIPIINFMYSGILEFHESLFDRLYSTAKLMNMSVLTKLLDAQKNPIKPVTPMPKRVQSVTPITWNLQGKKIMTKGFMEPDLPETLPGRKLPIWKRKSAPTSVSYVSANSSSNYDSFPVKVKSEEAPKPTRFEWPDEEDSSFENSFDDISYTSKPLILPSLSSIKEKSPKPSTSSTFEEIKRTAMPVKRSASPIGNQCKKVNIQDVKEYLKEHKIRSDFIDYDDAEMADNDLQTYDNDDSNEECSKDAADIFAQNTDESPSKSILKSESSSGSGSKHVRFSLEGKENTNVKIQTLPGKPQVKSCSPKTEQNTVDMSKHTKIITEVLKKYPHLVKNNKNIRLKILAKGNNSTNTKPTKTQIAAKPVSKVSYMVMKPDPNQKLNASSSGDKEVINNPDATSWECTRCEEPRQFKSYQSYRQHLTEAHNEKQDSQMCILCGHISRKQNMLVYHKYVKHNIPPPAMYNFPRCKECDHVALSQTLLTKHQLTHTVLCSECGTSFTSKAALISHLQQTGHTQDKVTPNFSCNYCDKRFFSENILNTHIKRSHEAEYKQQVFQVKEENIKTEVEETVPSTSKEKIKIISDIKVNTTIPTGALVPVKQISDLRSIKEDNTNTTIIPEPLEPSSEAEALSNVASGIAASLGLVDTIVVLDDNQFILQSTQHGNIQENLLNNSGQDYILPNMRFSDLATITSTSMEQVTQHPTVTLSSDTNTVLTQSLNKSGMTSTDELVMVLTDHDYSDAANNAVITDNNIVVLYSHPVQTQAMMINSETGMIEVGKNYAVTSEIPVSVADQDVNCEESIEMIQQEINNQLETESNVTEQRIEMQQYVQHNIQTIEQEKMESESCVETDSNTYQVCSSDVSMILQEQNQQNQIQETVQMEEIPMTNNQDLEESIEMIQEEINRIPQEVTQEIVAKVCDAQINEAQETTIRSDAGVETIQVTQDSYQPEINDENNYVTITSNIQYSQDKLSTYPQNISTNEEQTIENDESHINMISDPCITSQEKQTDNMPIISSDIENKEIRNETEVKCDSENSQLFTSEDAEQLGLVEQSDYLVKSMVITENLNEINNQKDEQQNDYIVKRIEILNNPNETLENSEETITENIQDNMEPSIQENVPENIQIMEQESLQILQQSTQERLQTMDEDMHTIEQDTQVMEQDLQVMEQDPQVMQQEPQVMQQDPQVMQQDLQVLEHDSQVMEQDTQVMDQDTQVMEQDIQEMQQDMKIIEQDTQIIHVDGKVAENENVIHESVVNIQEQENVAKETDENIISTPSEHINNLENSNELTEPSCLPLAQESNVTETETTKKLDDLNNMENTSQKIPKEIEEFSNKMSDLEIAAQDTNVIQHITEDLDKRDEDNSSDSSDEYKVIKGSDIKNIKIEKKELKINTTIQNEKISKLLDDWDDGDTDSQQSFSKPVLTSDATNNSNSINKLIDDWEDEEDT